MKHWFKLYVCTLRKDLSIILAIAILFIFVMDMWLKNIPAPNSFFVAIGNFWYALSIAYVSSFVFYFFVVHYNRQKEKSSLYGYIGGLFNMIINDGKSIFADMVKKAGLNIDPKKMTQEQIEIMCSSTNPLAPSTIMDFNGTHYINWLEYLDYYRNRKEEYLNKILKQMQYLDVEFVNILNQFISPQIFISLDLQLYMYRHNKYGNKKFCNGIETTFVEYYFLLKKSEDYYKKVFKLYVSEIKTEKEND